MEMNDDISELKDSIGQVLVTITPEMCRQIMLSLPRRLQLCVQSGGHTSRICVKSRICVSGRRDADLFFFFLVRRSCELVSIPVSIVISRLYRDSRIIGRPT